jgi:dTDP-4-amino-4,6-dideoxygalactose transaminase
MINVTKTFLPPLEKYIKYLDEIWETKHITNHGKFSVQLENDLKEYLGVKHLFLVNNGTIALQIALKTLQIKGKVITTPFSYVATTSSLVWEGFEPVFTDIDKNSFCLDPDKIEAQITPKVKAILATHVYGNPCDVEAIERLAGKHNLRVVYDAAHAFGVTYKGESILNHGDISTISFHATKLFHTAEGGAIITNDDDLAHKISYMRNFGHNGPEHFWGIGINGKSSELHAAMGLCILPEVNNLVQRRKDLSALYDQLLLMHGLQKQVIRAGTTYNYAYYPVLFPCESALLSALASLNANQIFPRRYFFPSLNFLNYVEYHKMPISEDIASRVLCLPLYHDLTEQEIGQISGLITNSIQ